MRALIPLIIVVMSSASFAATVPETLSELKQKQLAIRESVLQIAEKMDVQNPVEKAVRQVLYSLSGNELVIAIQALEVLESKGADEARVKAAVEKLITAQDRAIEVLERLLGIVAKLEERAEKAAKGQEEGTDLPDDVVEKLKELRDKLKEFLKEQKKVIDATQELAKTPVDDFTPEQEQKLQELMAIEDDWSKFMKEAHSDLSKLPEQDFSNPTLLKELLEIYSEVEMAKDALSKKSVEIAVSVEEAGAELAESLTTHIEKWLLDEPDRQKWSMEEPLQDYEVPMAELPSELEDLIGDLMEEEEDLFDDIEDVSSGWADSLDKGAGWGTADGPISNMSAQGVTGNTLPNSSEIGGRSGEGRSGKSGGEFVEETAVGKGGRRTPTRLTPDPYEKGVIKDTSKEPTGGSTGGGKISGGGGEGLEGPVPPPVQQQMAALAGRQADLRNKAERLQLGFQVMRYPTETISRIIQHMKEVEEGLRRGRIHQVMRKRAVLLGDLKNTAAYLKGEVMINTDRSVGLPNFLQDEMISAMSEQAPKGYEELLKKYYERLSTAK